jgi:protoporphyrinogen oxidase
MVEKNVICGAGLAGLAAGIDLATKGRNVTILEKGNVVGGHASSHRLPNGYVHDMGIHVIIPDAVPLYEMVKTAGIERNLIRSDMQFGFLKDGKVNVFSPNPLSMTKFKLIGLRDKIRFGKLIMGINAFSEEQLSNVTAAEFVTDKISRKALESFFEPLLTRMSGVPPEALSAAFFIAFIKLLGQVRNFEVCIPKTGIGELAEGLASHLKSVGGRVRTCSEVKEIKVTGEQVDGVVYVESGEEKEIQASNVISTMPLKDLPKVVDLPKQYEEKLKGIEYTEYMIAYFGLENRLSKYDLEVMIPQKEGFCLNSFVEVSNITRAVAPEGKSLFSAITTPSTIGKQADDEKVLDVIIEDLKRLFPEFEQKTLWRKLIRHPCIAVTKEYMERKPTFATPIKGLYLAGAQLFPLQDMVTAVVSGHIVSDMINGTK